MTRHPEHYELAATVRSLLAKHADPAAVRASLPGYDGALWRLLCDQVGVAALAIGEEFGGAGFSITETLVVAEEMGYSLAPNPLLPSAIATELLLALPASATRDESLTRIAAGAIATVAWPGFAPGCNRERLRWRAGLIHGTDPQVLFGAEADLLLAVTESRTGPVVVLLEATAEPVPAMDPTTCLGRLAADGTPAQALTRDTPGAAGADHPGATAVARAGRAALALAAAELVGCAARGLDLTVEYARERIQFGRPIGSFQAIKHRLADLLVAVETSRSVVHALADPLDEHLVAVALAQAGEAAALVAAETVQLHGGVAITWEHDAHLVFKRAHTLRQLFGTPAWHRSRLELDPTH